MIVFVVVNIILLFLCVFIWIKKKLKTEIINRIVCIFFSIRFVHKNKHFQKGENRAEWTQLDINDQRRRHKAILCAPNSSFSGKSARPRFVFFFANIFFRHLSQCKEVWIIAICARNSLIPQLRNKIHFFGEIVRVLKNDRKKIQSKNVLISFRYKHTHERT